MRLYFILALCFCSMLPSGASDRILIDAQVNGQNVCLCFDTGAEHTLLFEKTAKRLNLRFTLPSENKSIEPGRVRMGLSEECRFTLGRESIVCRMPVFEPPFSLPLDLEYEGFLAWANIWNVILYIDANSQKLAPLPELPQDTHLWNRWYLDRKLRFLTIKIPQTTGAEGTILIDTGSPFGVHLNTELWNNWHSVHEEQPCTLNAYYSPSEGIRIHKECWAEKLPFGHLSVTNVPVMQSSSVKDRFFENYMATFGMFALRQLDIIVDGKQATVYTRRNSVSRSEYEYNRLGAAFVPNDMDCNDLIAHVIEEGPAYKAGLRDGDILLRVNDHDVTEWRKNPQVKVSSYWSRPAGTKHELVMMRDGQTLEITVQLNEIFPLESTKDISQ